MPLSKHSTDRSRRLGEVQFIVETPDGEGKQNNRGLMVGIVGVGVNWKTCESTAACGLSLLAASPGEIHLTNSWWPIKRMAKSEPQKMVL